MRRLWGRKEVVEKVDEDRFSSRIVFLEEKLVREGTVLFSFHCKSVTATNISAPYSKYTQVTLLFTYYK